VFTYSQVGTSQVKSQPKTKEEIKSPKKSLTGSGVNGSATNKKNDIKTLDNVPTPKKIEPKPLILSPRHSRAKEE
jgi:hypothetical protein